MTGSLHLGVKGEAPPLPPPGVLSLSLSGPFFFLNFLFQLLLLKLEKRLEIITRQKADLATGGYSYAKGGIARDCSLQKGKSVTLDFKGFGSDLEPVAVTGSGGTCMGFLGGPWTPEGSFRQLLAVPGEPGY